MHAPCTHDAHTTRAPLALQVLLHEWLLASPHRTLDPTEADWFYVPVYATCAIATPHAYMPRTCRAHAVHAPCKRRARAVHTHTPCAHLTWLLTWHQVRHRHAHLRDAPHAAGHVPRRACGAALPAGARLRAVDPALPHATRRPARQGHRRIPVATWCGLSRLRAAPHTRGEQPSRCGPNQGLRAQSGAAVLL